MDSKRTHQSHFGTTAAASSIRAVVAPASPACADGPGHHDASVGLGHVPAEAESVEEAEGCNCSPYQTCQFCTCPCGVTLDRDGSCPACETDRVCSNFDDASMDSFYGRYAADCRQRESE